MAGAELLGLLREPLRHRVGHPGRHVGASPRQDADDDADDVAARLLLRVALGQGPLPGQDRAELAARQGRGLGRGHRPHHLGDGKHADQRRDHLDAAEKVRDPEGEAGRAGRVLDADAGNEKAEQHGGDGLHRGGAGNEGRAHQPQEGEPEILEGGEGQGHLGERRGEQDQRQRPGDPSERREPQANAERQFRLPFPGHGVGLVRVGGGGRGAGDAQEAAGDVAGEDRHGGSGDDGSDGGHGGQIEGDRHQQRRRHGGGQAGERADHEAVDRGEHERREHVRGGDEPHSFKEGLHRLLTRASGRGRRAAARARACRRRGAPRRARAPRAARRAASGRRAPARSPGSRSRP